MCVTCDCGKVHDNHGDSRNITMDQFQKAASAAGKSMDEMMQSVNKWVRQPAGSGDGGMGGGDRGRDGGDVGGRGGDMGGRDGGERRN